MSFIPLTGPAVLTVGARPREGSIVFSDDRRTVSLPIVSAVPVLTRALRDSAVHPSVGLLGAAAQYALKLIAEGKYDTLSDGSRAPVIQGDDVERLRLLAEFRSYEGVDGEGAEALAWAMVAATIDGMPGGSSQGLARRAAESTRPAGSLRERMLERQRARAAELEERMASIIGRSGGQRRSETVDDGLPAEISLSIRIEADEESLTEGVLRAVLQVHDEANPLHFADASVLWHDDPRIHHFGPRTRQQISLRLAEATRAWAPLERMRFQASPTELILEGDEVGSLLGEGVAALKAIGVDVMWPRSLGRELKAQAVLDVAPRPREESDWEEQLNTGLFARDDLFAFRWQLALGDEPLTDDEMDELAKAASPILKLRGSWTVVDPGIARKARKRMLRPLTGAEALGAALTGVGQIDGRSESPLSDVIVGATIEKLKQTVAEVGRGELLPVPPALRATLRDYQRRGLTWLAELTALGLGGVLADDMGLGKTVQLIALHLHRGAGPTLVVCPTSLMGNWEAEIARFAPGAPVRRFHGGERDLTDARQGFVLTTYGTMRRDARLLATVPWDLVVADEAQHLKNPASATARAIRTIPGTARVALTGTPVENDLSELWAILDWCVPGLLGSRKAFRKAWAAPIEAGIEAPTKQFADMVAPFLLRRRKTDPGIAPELPPKTETDHLLSLTKEQTVLYEAYVRDTMERIERLPGDDPARRGLILMMLTGLKQICNHPAQFLKQSLKQTQGRSGGRSQKLDLLDEVIETATSEGGAVLVFTQYVAMARLLEEHWTDVGIAHQFLHGGTPVAERERMIAAFQDGHVPVFLLSLKAGGTGLNLTRADHVVHVDRWWNPAVEDQASDRAWRIGQTKPVQVHRLVMRGTLEERIALLLEHKRALAEAVLGRGESALTELSNADLRDLVTLDRDGVNRAWR
ncbi:DEAD/DEAH box helicase [Nocardioides sp. Kera G14]|uniref:DEAD/DEAH box helicase n=1 Tax=Nocardioides sp. Kera G14 TaxID=2884264 RepID=UPI001D123DA4|nr:DEAD/DEAH box helicase [Nocardioides sp. Kera G14]UDY23366.1 DEAD/DEAH box helicase [Nocardioides sp. Kera G14]